MKQETPGKSSGRKGRQTGRSLPLFDKKVKPYSDTFGEALRSYCDQMQSAIRKKQHHD